MTVGSVSKVVEHRDMHLQSQHMRIVGFRIIAILETATIASDSSMILKNSGCNVAYRCQIPRNSLMILTIWWYQFIFTSFKYKTENMCYCYLYIIQASYTETI